MQDMKLTSILEKQKKKLAMITDRMENLPANPMALISDVFAGGDLFLAERLKQEGEHVLLESQAYWMSHLLPVLSEYFGMEEVTIQYDQSIPLAPLWFIVNEQPVALCSIYWRTFQELGIPGEAELYEERKQVIQAMEEKEAELERWAQVEENPALLGEDDTWAFAKASFNPKKYKKLAKEEAMKVYQEIQALNHRLISIDLKIERINSDFLETSYLLDRIKTRVAKWGDFTFYEPEKEGE